ncbi:N-formylglutamate amidohydrolase [Roseimaritima ulvae]|uniref:N-formylglutamate amidohydrolase n=1 Tax=Roseimaritima ulvae TaxID=980254 RepID=A0A5B9QKN9_9BACT|nr:N-formylglutamate amidohydrolase [Roseimaritima ulvae]QEG38312.1 N-formylglutamate amidohydrolase [Roseimaritima ulvae]
MSAHPVGVLITCEHGGNDVPDDLRDGFATVDAARHLNSHRGYDPGSLLIAQWIAQAFAAPLEFSTVSRLVVDLNRSVDSLELFSKFIRNRELAIRHKILQTYYYPYRERVSSLVAAQSSERLLLHLSIHTFTPRYRGQIRRFDLGVLFDPTRSPECVFGERLVEQLRAQGFRTLANQPYEGIADGLTTALRAKFARERYVGIELEVNNRFAKLSAASQEQWCKRIIAAVKAVSL